MKTTWVAVAVLLVTGGAWAQCPIGTLPIEATPDQVVTFRLRSPEGGGHARFVWTAEKGDKEEILFTVPGDGAWHDYRLRPCWQAGRVSDLTFKLPPELPATAKYEVADLRVSPGDACDVDAATADGIVFTHRDTAQHYATVLWTRAGESSNCQAKFTTMPDGREHAYWFDLTKLFDKKGPFWRGRCTSLSVVRLFKEFPSEVRPLGVSGLRFVKGCPDLPADPVITGARPLEAIPRAGRPLAFEIVVRNLGTHAVEDVSFAVEGLPKGVRVRFCEPQGTDATIPPSEGFDAIGCAGSSPKAPGERDLPNERIYRLVADDPGVGAYDVRVTLRAKGVEPRVVRIPVEVKPSLGLPRADYVPEPQPVKTGDFEVGALLFPGWSPEVHRWSVVASRALERKPLLGWYDERQPETIDWQIKHLVENGISYVSVDWYWDRGRQRLNHWMTAFAAARYRHYLKWHLMWANHNEPKSHSEADMRRVTRYWIANFFRQPEYQKVDGKPVVTLWSTWTFNSDMGPDGCRRALEIAREEARKAGFPGIHFIAMRFPEARTDAAQIAKYRKMGFDETTVYKYCGFGDPKAERDAEGAFPYRWVVETSLAHWRALKAQGFPFVPNLSTGYDDRPWRGEWGWSTSDITAADFRRICRDARRFGEETGQRRFLLGPIDEWGEGSIAYPNAEHGFGMLEAVRDAFGEKPADGWPLNFAPADVGRTCPQMPQPNDVQQSVAGGMRGKLMLPFADLTLTPSVAFPGWQFFEATSGCTADADGSRPFGITPIWDQRVKFAGRLRLAETPDQAVRVTYEIVPEKEAKLDVMGLGGTLPFDGYAGGSVETDGSAHSLAKDYPGKQVIAGGSFTNVVIRDGKGTPRVGFSSIRPFSLLVQDARGWKQKGFALRFAFPSREVYRPGETNALSLVVSAPRPLAVTPSVPETLRSTRSWIPLENASPWIEPGSALDFSGVVGAEPTTRLGRVKVAGDHFECAARPGEARRFYGVNLCADLVDVTDEQIDRFVENLVRTGYNSLRIHHHGDWLTTGARQTDGCTLNEPRARRLDRLMAACARCGVYVTTDLYVSRHAPYSALGIDRKGEAGMGDIKHLVFVHEGAYRNFAAFSSNLLCRVNTVTGVRYADDPTLAFVSMLNESSLVSGGSAVLRAWPCWQAAWKTWLAERRPADPAFSSVSETIPETLTGAPTPHKQAFALFLSEMEERFYRRTQKLVRETLGCKALLTNMNGVVYPIVYQRVRAELHDFVDEHYYIDHPEFLGTRWWGPPYTFPNVNPLKGRDAGVPNATIRRIFGKPFTVSEYRYCGPGRYRAISGTLTGAMASLQDWSALWHFAWSHGPDGIVRPETTKSVGMFDVSGDPIAQLAERTVAALFLRGDVRPLSTAAGIRLDRADLTRIDGLYGLWQTRQQAGFAGAAWRTRIGMFLGAAPDGVTDVGTYPAVDNLSAEAVGPSASSESGVTVCTDTGTLTVATPRSCAVFAEGGACRAGALAVELGSEPAAVACIAVDGKPLAESRRLLVTHLTDVQNTGVTYADEGRSILLKPGDLPLLVRAGEARVSLSVGRGEWEVWALSTTGARRMRVPVEATEEGLAFVADVSRDPVCATLAYEVIAKDSFQTPPDSAKPIVRWFWMGEDISASGITHDLAAMKAMGVRGANIMFQSWFGQPRGPVKIFSEDWWRLVMFAGKEADRLGLELSFHLCPGWSSSGGSSVKPEDAQKVLRFTESQIKGGCRVTMKLPQVDAPFGWTRQVATLAVPLREGEAGFVVTPEASAPNTFVFPEERDVSSAVVSVRNAQKGDLALDQLRLRYVVEVSSDGQTFREHARLAETAMESEHVLTFPRVTARAVRLAAEGGRPDIVSVRFSSVPLIPHYARKTLTSYCRRANVRPRVPADTFDCPADLALAPDQVIDVSSFVSDDGTLVWDVPAGVWRILRFTAVVQANATNHIAPPGGSGLEVDKLSPKAAEVALGILVDPLLARARREGIRAFKMAFLDSFEVPVQNWTDDFAAEFRRRRGYDLVPYLPTFTGTFVGSTERTERFLDDFRKTWAELFAENYGDRLCAAVRARGLAFMRQSFLGPFDELRAGREADVPAVEFWYKTPLPRVDFGALAASLGNVYGRRIVAAEALTDGIASAGDVHNEQIPLMRKIGDKAFADGINLFELHGFEHQPSDDSAQRKKWPFGCRFDRHHPDFASFRPFCTYLTRVQYLLQQGRGVSDILYLTDGPSPVQAAWEPAAPFGWKGDCIDPDTFRRDVRKVGDKWVLPHGMEYRVLVKSGTSSDDLAALLAAIGLPPDFAATENGRPVVAGEVAFVHRTTPQAEIYFVSNQGDRTKSLQTCFRAQGACEILDAETGTRQPIAAATKANGTSELTLDLPAGKSRFVVFGHK